jgi:hypothetical protein
MNSTRSTNPGVCSYCYDQLSESAVRVGRDWVCPNCVAIAKEAQPDWVICVSAQGHRGRLSRGKKYEVHNRGMARESGEPILLILDDQGVVNSYPESVFDLCDLPRDPGPSRVALSVGLC